MFLGGGQSGGEQCQYDATHGPIISPAQWI